MFDYAKNTENALLAWLTAHYGTVPTVASHGNVIEFTFGDTALGERSVYVMTVCSTQHSYERVYITHDWLDGQDLHQKTVQIQSDEAPKARSFLAPKGKPEWYTAIFETLLFTKKDIGTAKPY
tara:strand:+ start:37 stop:405 length:369 start_codon:yes stop_codon:yes gene_type:complete